jgi:hypothetical protein
MTKPLTLTAGTRIRLATWVIDTATVGSVEAFSAQSHEEGVRCGFPRSLAMTKSEAIQEGLERVISHGHELAWTVYAGSALVNDPSEYHRAKRAEHESALVVEDGILVEIEGRPYRIKVLPGQTQFPKYSDPIKFIPV